MQNNMQKNFVNINSITILNGLWKIGINVNYKISYYITDYFISVQNN